MNSIWDLISELIAPLLGSLVDHKVSGKKIDWGRNFRLLSVGFLGVSILMFIFMFFGIESDVYGTICCTSPFFATGLVFLIFEIIRKNNSTGA